MVMSASEFHREQMRAEVLLDVRKCCKPNCDHAAIGTSAYCAMHRHELKITCHNPTCSEPSIAGSKYCQRHFVEKDGITLGADIKKQIREAACIVEPVNPFIQLRTYLNDPCTVRVDQVVAIVGNKVHIDSHTVITLLEGEVNALHHRIEQYYGGSTNAKSTTTQGS
jgi:hypothetical protein